MGHRDAGAHSRRKESDDPPLGLEPKHRTKRLLPVMADRSGQGLDNILRFTRRRSATTAGDYGCSNATVKGECAFGVTNLTSPQVVAVSRFSTVTATSHGVITKATPLPLSSHRQDRKEEPTRSIPTAKALDATVLSRVQYVTISVGGGAVAFLKLKDQMGPIHATRPRLRPRER